MRKLYSVLSLLILVASFAGAQAPTSISIITDITGDTAFVIGQQITLTVSTIPATANNSVTWISSDTSVATINSVTGALTAVKAGNFVVFAVSDVNILIFDSLYCKVVIPADSTGYSIYFTDTVISNLWVPEHDTDPLPVFTLKQSVGDLQVGINKMGPLNANKTPVLTWKTATYGFSALRIYLKPNQLLNMKNNPYVSITMKASSPVYFQIGVNSINSVGNPSVVADSVLGSDFRTYIFDLTGVYKTYVDSTQVSNFYLNFNPYSYQSPTFEGNYVGTVYFQNLLFGSDVDSIAYLNYIRINATPKVFKANDSLQLTATVRPLYIVKNATVIWTVSDTALASISPSGKLFTKKLGTVKVYAMSANKMVVDSATIQITIPVTSITLSVKNALKIYVGNNAKVNVTVLPADALDTTFTWSTSNPDVSVDTNNVFHGTALGMFTLTATANDGSGVKGSVAVKVISRPVTSVTVIAAEKYLSFGDTLQLITLVKPDSADNKNVSWSINNPNETIDSTGLLWQLPSCSDTLITVTAKSVVTPSVSGKISLYMISGPFVDDSTIVISAVGGVSIITKNQKLQMIVDTVTPGDASVTDVIWSVNNPALASISDSGLLTANADTTIIVIATSVVDSSIKGTYILNKPAGLVQEESVSIGIYPIPVIDILHVQNALDLKAEIINVIGVTEESLTITDNDQSINLSKLSDGIYFIRFTSKEGIVTTKKFSKSK